MPLSSNEFAMNHHLAKSKQAACPLMSKFQLKVMIVTSSSFHQKAYNKPFSMSLLKVNFCRVFAVRTAHQQM